MSAMTDLTQALAAGDDLPRWLPSVEARLLGMVAEVARSGGWEVAQRQADRGVGWLYLYEPGSPEARGFVPYAFHDSHATFQIVWGRTHVEADPNGANPHEFVLRYGEASPFWRALADTVPPRAGSPRAMKEARAALDEGLEAAGFARLVNGESKFPWTRPVRGFGRGARLWIGAAPDPRDPNVYEFTLDSSALHFIVRMNGEEVLGKDRGVLRGNATFQGGATFTIKHAHPEIADEIKRALVKVNAALQRARLVANGQARHPSA